MNMEQFRSFMPKGKMQDALAGTTVIAPINSGLRLIPNFVSIKPSFTCKLDKMIDRIWGRVKKDYYGQSHNPREFKMGSIVDSLCSSDIFVISMVVKDEFGMIDSGALEKALVKLCAFAKDNKGSVHISQYLIDDVPPLRELLDKYCAANGINCYFYAYPSLPVM